MLLSNLTQWVGSSLSAKEAIKINADAGFDAYDISLFQLTRDENYEFNAPDYVEKAKALRAYADSLGIVCNQSHAPFPSSVGKEEEDKVIFEKIMSSEENDTEKITQLIANIEDENIQTHISEIMVTDYEITSVEKCIEDVIIIYNKERLQNRKFEIIKELENPELTREQATSLEMELSDIILQLAKIK